MGFAYVVLALPLLAAFPSAFAAICFFTAAAVGFMGSFKTYSRLLFFLLLPRFISLNYQLRPPPPPPPPPPPLAKLISQFLFLFCPKWVVSSCKVSQHSFMRQEAGDGGRAARRKAAEAAAAAAAKKKADQEAKGIVVPDGFNL